MSENTDAEKSFPMGRYVMVLVSAWTFAVAAILVWGLWEHDRHNLEAARIQARG